MPTGSPRSRGGAERGYAAADFVNELRSMNVRPQVIQNLARRHGSPAIDGRTTEAAGYDLVRLPKLLVGAIRWPPVIAP